ncbi:hypothetical protein U973_00813 [Staphylococcus aureus 56864-11]|uniref:formate/nitrite transporter family protein n=1 Tax=Staphylococcus aureus TaxID=1280 RepID=UPI0004471E04|nr:formate/nitrite transporter family protein [Staphylococcus aureus]EZW71155.1 hypothetical protein U973_00813 [Staphylococcus aureus 56864-11]MBU7302252.1 formate/nitrite transporter family protein [Staphylococcus aureus]MBU7304539.1 formate/nitrite transporter family protein [Staphylococcus aureus]MCL9696036.1 formate/nitrite transporter [Staphylococcus aureus]MCO4435210.1 formate/nitrite transporter [Staphylococcus aureus]
MKEKHIKWDKIFYGDDWVNNVVETIRTKDILQSVYLKRYLLRAMMAGFIIGIITVFVLSVKATHEPDLPPGIVNMASAITFSFALVLILFTNSELLTSNFMYFTVGLYYKVIKPTRVLKIFLLCFAGNILGAAILFSFMRFSNVMTPDMLNQLSAVIEHKTLSTGFVSILMKAIFAFMGYEHVVYNSCLFMGGLIYQVDTLHFIPAISNIAAAFIGNYIGGGLIIGLFYAYLNDHHQFYKNN